MGTANNEFLNELNKINTKPAKLTEDEYSKLEQDVFAKILINSENNFKKDIKANKQNPRAYKLAIIKKICIGVASCLILAVFLNITTPAFAEQLPIIGDLFAWFNSNTAPQLKSDSLGEFSENVYLTPNSIKDDNIANEENQGEHNSQNDTINANNASAPNFVITQIYCDGLYLRLAVQITVSDNSLSQFEWLSIDPYSQTPLASGLNGSVYINGQEVFLNSGFTKLQKKDNNTYIGNLTYKLQTVITQSTPHSTQIATLSQDVTKPFNATLYINSINGYTGNYVYNSGEQINEYEKICVLDEMLTFEIEVTPNISANRIYDEKTSQNGIVIENITATPGETQIKYFVPKEFNNPAITLQTSSGLRLYPLGGFVEFTDDGEWAKMDFDAIPLDVDEVKIYFIDKNADNKILAEFICVLK